MLGSFHIKAAQNLSHDVKANSIMAVTLSPVKSCALYCVLLNEKVCIGSYLLFSRLFPSFHHCPASYSKKIIIYISNIIKIRLKDASKVEKILKFALLAS